MSVAGAGQCSWSVSREWLGKRLIVSKPMGSGNICAHMASIAMALGERAPGSSPKFVRREARASAGFSRAPEACMFNDTDSSDRFGWSM
jgi:hypothetical protein